ncbi:hypothetical protein [Desulfobacter sp.]|uniref:hypothetical protein n=1 Tax=Desulfobacter sp. TaxID=2294 RepID=UPI003D0C8AD8
MKKNQKNRIWVVTLAALAISFFTCSPVQAHFPWLLLEDGAISANTPEMGHLLRAPLSPVQFHEWGRT